MTPLCSIAIAVTALASVPIAFVLKIRRNGITDADYSVSTGINYEQALKSARDGFEFLGLGASKLRACENELRDAVSIAEKRNKKIRFLLLDPDRSAKVFERLEKMDGTSGYTQTVGGSHLFLRNLEKEKPDCVEIRLYEADSVAKLGPLRLFFHDDVCLASPFAPSNGEKDQGRGLPQLRVTSKGFPKSDDVTLYAALKKNFDIAWDGAKGDSIE